MGNVTLSKSEDGRSGSMRGGGYTKARTRAFSQKKGTTSIRTYLSQTTGSEGVSFLLPQLFFSQHRLERKKENFVSEPPSSIGRRRDDLCRARAAACSSFPDFFTRLYDLFVFFARTRGRDNRAFSPTEPKRKSSSRLAPFLASRHFLRRRSRPAILLACNGKYLPWEISSLGYER